jgi:hypothetical protein
MGGGAWPFLVSGVICLVNSDNERDPSHLNRSSNFGCYELLRGTMRNIIPQGSGAITGL